MNTKHKLIMHEALTDKMPTGAQRSRQEALEWLTTEIYNLRKGLAYILLRTRPGTSEGEDRDLAIFEIKEKAEELLNEA